MRNNIRVVILLIMSLLFICGCQSSEEAPSEADAIKSVQEKLVPANEENKALAKTLIQYRPEGAYYFEIEDVDTGAVEHRLVGVDANHDLRFTGTDGKEIYIFKGKNRTIINEEWGVYLSDTIANEAEPDTSPYFDFLYYAKTLEVNQEGDQRKITDEEGNYLVVDETGDLLEKKDSGRAGAYVMRLLKKEQAFPVYEGLIQRTKELKEVNSLDAVRDKE